MKNKQLEERIEILMENKAYFAIGELYERMGLKQKAEEFYEMSYRNRIFHHDLFNAALACVKLGKIEKAIAHCLEAGNYFTAGSISRDNGMEERAREYFKLCK